MTIFTCSSDFESMMTCIYDAWDSHLGYRNVRLMTEPVGNYELFCDYRHVDLDAAKAERVIHSIRRKISPSAYQLVYYCAMSHQEDRLDIIYRFLLYGFSYGAKAMDMLQEPAVMAAFELSRRVSREAHAFIEFVRFANVRDEFLVSHIEPKSNVLTLIAPHFSDRLPSENWMIIDDKRNLAVVHPADAEYYLTPLTKEELLKVRQSEQEPDPFVDLWIGFFHAIAIDARKNPRCQRTLLPLWYRKNMTEYTQK
ncbi:MAG: TIGR03915 family putative DNA repair protein [Fusicatenibacter sp.]|nr:TIGR03915 family putative DNA repair protein [Lachnospiraceae bacterium]MDY2938498.1 TIGR03915 family putative DNA repair protein [Fusicatenibacter sp.]